MPVFKRGEVVKVPFPCTDRTARQFRPALVVCSGEHESDHDLLWVLMITSADNRGWPGDVVISNLTMAGLPAPSVIRTAKIATIEAADATRLGKVTAPCLRQVLSFLQAKLGN